MDFAGPMIGRYDLREALPLSEAGTSSRFNSCWAMPPSRNRALFGITAEFEGGGQ